MKRGEIQHQAYLLHKKRALKDPEVRSHFETGLDRVRLAASIVAMRKALNLSQTDLAARIDSSPSIVSKLERGGNVELNTIEKVAKALDAQIVIDMVPREKK
ncbi:MAG: helix-turn-helix domain-containing protein [Firmicutes bacterium]|jgi:ribosome-binding protein aMBF1 (putative translation factor)|nr:helix-turn-helix domain-containing protein [Bacillota bacterium]